MGTPAIIIIENTVFVSVPPRTPDEALKINQELTEAGFGNWTMAKVNYGTIVADARGKINGVVMSKNKSGAYVRTKVTPTNPRTPAQQAVRATFGNLSQQWSAGLTASQRAQWTAYAQTYPRRDIFGNSLTLNGLNMFIALNAVLAQIGGVMTVTPPSGNLVNALTWASTFGTLSATVVDLNNTVLSAGAPTVPYSYIFATPPLPAGRSATPSDYRFVYSAVAPVSMPPNAVDIATAYIAKFGSPIPGQAIYALASTADFDTGLLSVAQPVSGIVS
jgi:hypothetical protein